MKNSYIVGTVIALGIAFWLGRRSHKKIDLVVARRNQPPSVEEVGHYIVHYIDIGDVPAVEMRELLKRYHDALQQRRK